MYEKLTKFLEEKNENSNAQDELVKIFDFSQATASRKLNQLLEFKVPEIRLFRKHYEISAELTIELFEL